MLLSSWPKSKQIVGVVSVSVLGFGWCVISISGVGNADACNVSRSGLAPIIYDQHLIEIVNNNVRYGPDESIREGNCLGQGSFGTCLITSV